jgi:predicted nucleotidyltransferase component of viral defense system
MITQKMLKESAGKNQTTELNVRREYFQHLFLSYFYRQNEAKNIYFKGGTALRLIYGSPRFSEDLDFSSTNTSFKEIETGIEKTLTRIDREGTSCEIIESKKTTGGHIAIIKFVSQENEIRLKIEISLRNEEASGEIKTIASDYIPPYIVIALSEKILLAQKIQALMTRAKPRDFYDLYFMLRKNMFHDEKKYKFQEILNSVRKTEISFKRELETFLPKSHWMLLKDFKKSLEKELESRL